jgi:tetratricopeptide (TPR) repeat protein
VSHDPAISGGAVHSSQHDARSEVGLTPTNANDRALTWYSAREPRVIVVLCAIAIASFFVVSGLSGFYRRELAERGVLWSARGRSELLAGRFAQAAGDFQAALTYSRNDYEYELNLAQALVALHRTEEARAYLISLWQRQPENGSVNLELARIYAKKDDVTESLRYYHNAIYAVWNGNTEAQQLAVRLELVSFLLDHKAFNLAESELIAFGRNVPEDFSLQIHVGDLFMRVPDYERALTIYQQALKLERHNSDALAKAGQAAFELGQYQLAERYLTSVIAAEPNDAHSLELLRICKLIPTMNPYNFFTTAKRDHIVLSDFAAAGERIKSCINSSGKNSSNSSLQGLYARWMELKAQLDEHSLRQNPNLTDSAMDLVFNIERETSTLCGSPTGDDLLLLLIARNHEGN